MVTEEQSEEWYEEVRREALRWLDRSVPATSEADRAAWASATASELSLAWSRRGSPPTRPLRLASIRAAARRVALETLDGARASSAASPSFAQRNVYLEPDLEDEQERQLLSVEELLARRARGGIGAGRELGRRAASSLDEEARRLRALLDRLAWPKDPFDEVDSWRLWLLLLRAAVGERVHGEEALERVVFGETLARLVLWHPGEEDGVIWPGGPTLGASWAAAVGALHQDGALRQQALGAALGGQGAPLGASQVRRWIGHARAALVARCRSARIDYEELMEMVTELKA